MFSPEVDGTGRTNLLGAGEQVGLVLPSGKVDWGASNTGSLCSPNVRAVTSAIWKYSTDCEVIKPIRVVDPPMYLPFRWRPFRN